MIHQRVLTAIVEHRLPPGTKLGEERLAKVFGVSRTQIRQVLERLSHDSIVTVMPNRGAFVSSPTADEAREVFAARRLIEPDLIRQAVAQRHARPMSHGCAQHVQRSRRRAQANDKRAIIRLSGEFHQLIADIAGNRFLAQDDARAGVADLPGHHPVRRARTCRPARTTNTPTSSTRSKARDAERAAALMVEHLEHVEASLNFDAAGDGEIDFEVALRDYARSGSRMRLLLVNANTSEFVTEKVAAAGPRAARRPAPRSSPSPARFGARVIGTRAEHAIGEHSARRAGGAARAGLRRGGHRGVLRHRAARGARAAARSRWSA